KGGRTDPVFTSDFLNAFACLKFLKDLTDLLWFESFSFHNTLLKLLIIFLFSNSLFLGEAYRLYQEKGKAVEIVETGEVIKCPPNVEHWHGATPTDTMTHVAIGTNTNIGGAVWLNPVSDTEYNKH